MELALALVVLAFGFFVAMRLPLGSVIAALITAASIAPLVLLYRSSATTSLTASFLMLGVQLVTLQVINKRPR